MAGLRQPKFVDVPRKSSLADLESAFGEGPLKILLAGQGAILEKFENHLMPNGLGHFTPQLNSYSVECINIQLEAAALSSTKRSSGFWWLSGRREARF